MLEDALSEINGDLLQEKRTLKALDSWGKQNTTSNQSSRSRAGYNSTSMVRQQTLIIKYGVLAGNIDKGCLGPNATEPRPTSLFHHSGRSAACDTSTEMQQNS